MEEHDVFGGGSGLWLFAILALLWGGNGGLFGGNAGRAATVEDINNSANFSRLESQVQNNGNLVETKFDSMQTAMQTGFTNIGNGICDLGYKTQADFAAVNQAVMESRYLNEKAISESNAALAAQINALSQKMDQNKIETLQNQINQLQLQNAMCGVVRYPTNTTYSAGYPFANCGCCNGGNV